LYVLLGSKLYLSKLAYKGLEKRNKEFVNDKRYL